MASTVTTAQKATDASTKPGTTSAPAEKGLTLREAVSEFSAALTSRESDYAPQLPAHITPEKFRAVATTAVNNNPELLRADRLSLLNACCRAATDGLLPDGREGALVIFNTKEKGRDGKDVWIRKVTWMPMVQGIIKKVRQSGEVVSFGARIVYQAEVDQGRFSFIISDGEEKLRHEPILFSERGAPVLAYSYAKYRSGHYEYEALTARDIEKIRSVSKSKDGGPWTQWFDEMAKKSVIRRHAKRLPNASELADLLSRDDELSEFDQMKAEARATALREAQRQLGAPQNGNGGSIIEAEDQPAAQPFDDPPDGEVIEGETYEQERARYTADETKGK